ncbi:hypothetical protein PRUB_a0102 [Pseudoalteromonas rubra]|uniref:Uncharacterized protein n=1 Tax=Pseudoalteromonas rubra TaxID=43658 RepID=A0A8T0C6S1_9GAMM|nr:hypothetical protein PRUB_a0102 [Pseudoalteromonas rubra]
MAFIPTISFSTGGLLTPKSGVKSSFLFPRLPFQLRFYHNIFQIDLNPTPDPQINLEKI